MGSGLHQDDFCHPMIRLSVGLEDAQELFADLDQAMQGSEG